MQDRHLSQLDGIRGVAILIVILGHLITRDMGFGITRLGPLPPIGVDLFFVLSGFLITNVLLRARGTDHFFKNFYARRALRIAPLYFALLIFMFAIANHRLAAFTFNDQKLHWQVFAFYLQNLYYHQASELGPLALAVTWSLAVEEQFYLLWPLLVSKWTIRNLSAVATGLVVIAPVARVIVPKFGYDPYINPLCRADAMAMGALLSLWIWRADPSVREMKRTAMFILAGGLTGEVVCHFLGITHIMSKSFVALMFVALLALSLSWEPLKKVLSVAPLRLTGKVSYCLYLAHPLAGALLYHELSGTSLVMRAIRSLLILMLSYSVALLSWTFFERPILSLKRYFESGIPQKGQAAPAGLPSAALSPVLGVRRPV
jgi:peptidoglycan/LPS O-acetylase OafA/YrhL